MNLQEMKQLKQDLITQGYAVYPTIAKIIDALGEYRRVSGRDCTFLEYDGIVAYHFRHIVKAKVKGDCFKGWLYRDSLFVTVGEKVALCPFRCDRVMSIHLDNETTEVTQADKDNEIFVPYHLGWHDRLLTLLPKAESILGEASKVDNQIESAKLSKELFLDEMER